ncbi:MAG: lipopolysaccharide biosynthesis protein [Frankiaceae bacterium]
MPAPPEPRPWRGLPRRRDLRTLLHERRFVLVSAASLLATTLVTAGLGFVYWAVAARTFSAASVGYGSAAISLMTLLGTVGMLGLGTLLIGEVGRRRAEAGGLIMASLLVSGGVSAAMGLLAAVLAPAVMEDLSPFGGDPLHATLFAVGVAVTGASLVLDQALVGLQRGGLQLWRNGVFYVAKLAALLAAAKCLNDAFGVGIYLSWTVGNVVSLAAVALVLRWRGIRMAYRPRWDLLRELRGTVMGHNWLNIAYQLPRLALPVVVTFMISPSAGAAFYAAWMLVGFAYVVPTHLSTALYAISTGDHRALSRELRFTVRVSVVAGLASAAVFGVAGHWLLVPFGQSYADEAGAALAVLGLGTFPTLVKVHYIAVRRVQGLIPRAAVLVTIGAVLELGAGALGAVLGGITGVAIAVVLAMTVEALVMAPAVLRAMRAPRARTAGPAARVPAQTTSADERSTALT